MIAFNNCNESFPERCGKTVFAQPPCYVYRLMACFNHFSDIILKRPDYLYPLTHLFCDLLRHPRTSTHPTHLVTVGDDGETALFKAAAHGHASIVRRLLACGAAIDAPSKYGTTPLGAAVINRYAVGGRRV